MSTDPSWRNTAALAGDRITRAVVFEEPEKLELRWLPLPEPGPREVVVEVEFSGISTGTEKLLWSGRMPPFPGMGYPLVPGYETVGRVIGTGSEAADLAGRQVFVSGARCFGDGVHGLFGGAASRLVVPADKVLALDELGEEGTLFALAATALHAITLEDGSEALPELVVGHGVLGRLIARLTTILGAPPVVWETNPARRGGALGYDVVDPADDEQSDYRRIVDVSGDAGILDSLIARLGRHGEIVLAGFYAEPLSFTFPPAFMREAKIRAAAEWQRRDLVRIGELAASGRLSLAGLITHRARSDEAPSAYPLAFTDPDCLKMVLDWRHDA